MGKTNQTNCQLLDSHLKILFFLPRGRYSLPILRVWWVRGLLVLLRELLSSLAYPGPYRVRVTLPLFSQVSGGYLVFRTLVYNLVPLLSSQVLSVGNSPRKSKVLKGLTSGSVGLKQTMSTALVLMYSTCMETKQHPSISSFKQSHRAIKRF